MPRLRVVFSIGAMHGGGSERQIIHLLTRLDRAKFEPFLYLVSRTGPLLDRVPADVPIAAFEDRVPASRLYVPGLMHARRVQDFAKFLTEVRADVSYDRTFLMTLIAAAGAQRVGVPNVSTIVTNPETGFAPVAGRFGWFKRRMLRRLYNNSAQVLAVSDARESAIRFYGLRGDNVITHRNGVDVARIQSDAAQPVENDWWTAPLRSAGASRIVRIVSAGRLNHEKGFHLLIAALAELRPRFADVEFRLALLGEGSHRGELEQQIRSLSLSDHVLLPGFQDNAAAWFKSADMFVLPSLVEGMPNVLLEAMACGTPVIAADCQSGPREILDGGRLGILVAVNDAAALTAAIHSAIENVQGAQHLATAARQEMVDRWPVDVAARSLEVIFDRASNQAFNR